MNPRIETQLGVVTSVIVGALMSWNEEASGPKWAIHDSNRQCEEIVRALDAAGYVIVRKDRLLDA